MKTKKISKILLSGALTLSFAAGAALAIPAKEAHAAVYKENPYMEKLTLPTESQYEEKDWQKTTVDFLTYVFDENNTFEGENGTRKIARYTAANNAKEYFRSIGRADEAPEDIWSIPPYVGKGDDATLGEGITVIAAVMSGALNGMDLTAYKCSDGKTRNFVKSVVEYYQAVNGENVVLNGGAGGKTGATWWYELLPGVLFSVLGTQYESESYYMYDIITESARKWRSAVEGLGGVNADFYHTSYSFATGEPYDGNWYEPDAAAGMAYILYSAYSLNNNLLKEGKQAYATEEEIEKFREAAVWSMNYLEKLDTSPFYEVLTFFAPYLAARMNVEQGTNYDVYKMYSWLMDGSSSVRSGWGMITENWGDKYTNGLMGSLIDGGGYAFAMNTFDAMLGFAPMVKYDSRFARDISRWVLCASQSARSFYPSEYAVEGKTEDAGDGHTIYHGKYQSGNTYATDSDEATFVAYEGLRKYRRYVVWKNGTRSTELDGSVTPYASGDAFTYDWGGETDYGLYGTAHSGLFGATISYTDVPMIIRTDLSKLDVYAGGKIPFSMYYNPYTEAKQVTVTLSAAGNRLYDTIEKKFVETTSAGGNDVKISIAADATMVLAEIPEGKDVKKSGSVYTCDGEFIAQDRGFVSLSLYTDEACTSPVTAGSNVEDTIYASLSAVTPEGASVQGLTLSCSGATLYSGKSAPSGSIAIDTKKLKNGKSSVTATLTLDGGVVEKSSVAVQILNVVKTPALTYDSATDMKNRWNDATSAWASAHPESDHTSVASVNGDGDFTVTVNSPKGYGFATSELFTVDFSRRPMIEFEVSDVSAAYAVKMYVDGMVVHNNYTGVYLIKDTESTGKITIDVLAAIQKEDRTFKMSGAHKASVKIIPVGKKGDSVSIKNFNVYHMYTTPVLDEPDEYKWEHDFTAEWLSVWSGAESEGGVNNAYSEYTNDGLVKITKGESEAERYGVASPLITTDLSQNPVFDLHVQSLQGKYFVGLRFNGTNKLYLLADNKSDKTLTTEIMSSLRENYPDETFKGEVALRIIVGVIGDGEAEISEVETYYKLPAWGTTVKGDAWLDWEKSSDTTAVGTLTMDASNRAVIKNNGSSQSDTATAGMRGKFTLNFDYNPELDIQVRGLTRGGKWRITLMPMAGGTKYALTEWSASKTTIRVNLNEKTGGKLTGEGKIYLAVEVLGGGKEVTIGRINTYYTAIELDFATGKTLGKEMATWEKSATAPSNVTVADGGVRISEKTPGSRGVFTSALTADAAMNPFIAVNVKSLGANSAWYINATVNGTTYALTGQNGSTATGTTYIDVVSALAAAGLKTSGEFSAVYEFGGTGDDFSVVFGNVRFAYKLAKVTGVKVNEENVISWNAVPGADGYKFRIENAAGQEFEEKNDFDGTEYALSALALETGVYKFTISAYGEGRIDSDEAVVPFKQGDIESVTLGKPQNVKINGLFVEWEGVNNAEKYFCVLTDADGGNVLFSGDVNGTSLNLAETGLSAFNYRLEVTAKGDGAVYLDGEKATYSFYTNMIEHYNAKKFAAMTPNDNQASASFDSATGIASITVPYTNWGSVVTLSSTLNFDRSPVLAIRFAKGCQGGYFLKIMIDGKSYYLVDNTFDIHGLTEDKDVLVDIVNVLNTRKDGPASAITGTHKVQIVFGATSDGLAGVDSPVVKIAQAELIEMTQGSGVKKLGTLSEPVVTVNGKMVFWNAVEHAESYSLVVSNETGVLLTLTVTGTSYDLSILQREGSYTVMVTATASAYYASDAGSVEFEIVADSQETPDAEDGKKKGCKGSVMSAAILAASGLCAAVALKKKKHDKE